MGNNARIVLGVSTALNASAHGGGGHTHRKYMQWIVSRTWAPVGTSYVVCGACQCTIRATKMKQHKASSTCSVVSCIRAEVAAGNFMTRKSALAPLRRAGLDPRPIKDRSVLFVSDEYLAIVCDAIKNTYLNVALMHWDVLRESCETIHRLQNHKPIAIIDHVIDFVDATREGKKNARRAAR